MSPSSSNIGGQRGESRGVWASEASAPQYQTCNPDFLTWRSQRPKLDEHSTSLLPHLDQEQHPDPESRAHRARCLSISKPAWCARARLSARAHHAGIEMQNAAHLDWLPLGADHSIFVAQGFSNQDAASTCFEGRSFWIPGLEIPNVFEEFIFEIGGNPRFWHTILSL